MTATTPGGEEGGCGCSGYGPPPICDICERVVLDPHDPMDFGVCQACWREHNEMLNKEETR